ncbi:MAG: FG-GAP repeat domain-containing protein, partial [Myxococcota bacterium]
VFIGFGDGILSRSGLIPIDSPPSGLVLGDFDGDEVGDLMVSLSNNTVAFAKGLANNDFFDPLDNPVTVGQAPAGMVAVDLDGDDDLDLVVANQGGDSAPGTVSILRGNGNGTFTLVLQDDPEEPGSTINGLPAELGTIVVAVGNIDADPALDIVALNSNSQTITLYSGDGDLLFTPRGSVPVGAAPQDLALIDVNDDDKLDVLTADSNSDAIGVRFGNGDRTFAPATFFPVGNTPTQLRVADMNDDTLLDLVVANRRSGDVSLLLGDGMGAFSVARTFVADAEPQVLALGDFNGDDRLDPVASTQGSEGAPSLALLLNRDGATLQGVEDVLSGNVPTGVASADIDDDGATDVVVSGNSGDVYVFPSTTEGLGDPLVIEVGGRVLSVLAGDLNGDTLPDLAMVDTVNNRVGVALATKPGQFAALQLYATSTAPAGITSGDFNDDGRRDLAVSAIGPPGRASILLQQANGTFGQARAVAVEDTPLGIAAVESACNGGVRHDLVVANQASNTVTVLR